MTKSMVTGKQRKRLTFVPIFAAFICILATYMGKGRALPSNLPEVKMFLGAVRNIIRLPEVYETHYIPYETSQM